MSEDKIGVRQEVGKERQSMSIDILEIRNQRLSSLFRNFIICETCKRIGREQEREKTGYKCPYCGAESEPIEYLYLNALKLIDLMQELYHSAQEEAPDSKRRDRRDIQLAVVIFFCSLGEVLLVQFLENLMIKMGLPLEVRKRLLDDNQSVKQRLEKLFPTLTGVKKWKKAVRTLDRERPELNYIETVRFYEKVRDVRNKFVHGGNKWAIPQEMPEQCIRHIWPLVHLFVDLHNKYIALQNEDSK